MKKIKLGDLFEIKTPKGCAYIHYVYKDNELGELIRVLPQLYQKRPVDLDEISSQEERFMVFFPLSAAVKKKIIKNVGHYKIDYYQKPKYMRTEHTIKGTFIGWHIVNTETWQRRLVKTLTSEQKKLSPWGIWNDTLLVERITQGWSIEGWG